MPAGLSMATASYAPSVLRTRALRGHSYPCCVFFVWPTVKIKYFIAEALKIPRAKFLSLRLLKSVQNWQDLLCFDEPAVVP